MKIAICEDQVVQINFLNNHIKQWAKEKEINISIDNFTSAESFYLNGQIMMNMTLYF